MNVEIVTFPQTRIAAVEHAGSPALEHDAVRKLIAWKRQQRLLDPLKYRHYGIHYADPRSTPPSAYRADFGISFDEDVAENPFGVVSKVIAGARCARARDVGSRNDNKAAAYLHEQWLPRSGESAAGLPMVFHYVNVGPEVREDEMITDVYLPLK